MLDWILFFQKLIPWTPDAPAGHGLPARAAAGHGLSTHHRRAPVRTEVPSGTVKQRPARCAGLARTTGGQDISGSRSGVSAKTNDCALRMRASPSLQPTPLASGEIESTNGGLHSCQSVFAVGRAVACPGIGSPCISGVPQRAEFCCRMARTAGYARADAW